MPLAGHGASPLDLPALRLELLHLLPQRGGADGAAAMLQHAADVQRLARAEPVLRDQPDQRRPAPR